MKKFLLVFLLLGCDSPKEKSATPSPSWEAKQAEHIVYVKDSRTNLCFTMSTVSEYPLGTAVIFSNVPCTPGVEELIRK